MAQGTSITYRNAVTNGGTNDGSAVDANVRVYRATIALDDTVNFKGASGDTDLIARLPPGSRIKQIDVISSVSLTTSTLAFGIAGTAAKFGAAKAYGVVPDTIVSWATASAQAGVMSNLPVDVLMTIGVAALPTGATNIMVVDIIYSARG